MVCLVRSEDRKPSRRVFPLLQNLDLDSVTFAQVQSTGDPISIEDMNEQEMVDLIIVNLARLCVAGEWDGLLSAGGATGNSAETTAWGGTDFYWEVGRSSPYGAGTVQGAGMQTDMLMWPFISPNSGDISEMAIAINSGVVNTVSVCIYNDTDGRPDTLIGKGDFDISGSGTVTQTSFSATLTLEKGVQYWYGLKSSSANQPNLKAINADYTPSIGNIGTVSLATSGIGQSLNSEVAYGDSIPATLDPDIFTYTSVNRLILGLKF